MRFYTQNHQHYCGIDLHAKTMYVCVVNQQGDMLLHKNINTDANQFLALVDPYRQDLVVAVECIFTWYWLADLMAHIQNTVSQYNLPPLGLRADRKAQRPRIPSHFPDPVVQQMMQLDTDLIDYLSVQLRGLEQDLTLKAKAHDAFSYHLIRSVHGIGRILTLVILYEIEDVARFPTAGQFASYARLVKCSKESAGKKYGYSGKKIGNAYLKWAFSEAAVLFLKGNPPAQKAIQRLASKHGKGKALSILAHKLGRTVYTMLRKQKPFDQERFMAYL